MAEIVPELSSAYAAALIAEYGNERDAARAAGIGRSTLHDAAIGRSEWRPSTLGKITSALSEARLNAVERTAGLIRSVAGDNPRAQKTLGTTYARTDKRDPGSLRRSADDFERRMHRFRFDVWGNPLDARDRKITPGQERAYAQLLADYRAGRLDRDKYARFVGYQLGESDDLGDVAADVAPL